ncbi:MAG: hypothetical protein JKX70_08785 [Phycisphaerales bacterium]|nr:hypothetical protein [Phycisphaerales bacterium]
MKKPLTLITLLVLTLVSTPAHADQRSDDLHHALSRLEEGTALLEQHDPHSSAVLDEAAALLVDVIETHHMESPSVYHALGNAYMLSNDLGHAILAYRRGEQLDPSHIELRESLEFARNQVPISIEPSSSGRFWSIALAWRGLIDRNLLWMTFTLFFTAGWLALSTRLLGLAPRRANTLGTWLILLSVVPVTMLGSEWLRFQGSHDIVITASQVNARTGPNDEIYDLVFVDTLQAGVEATYIESRDGWSQIELANGSLCWVPELSIERVNSSMR